MQQHISKTQVSTLPDPGSEEIFKSYVQIRKVRQRKATFENCSQMINILPDSRRSLHCCVKLQVAMSYYPCLANGRRRQIIHLPWWRRVPWEVSAGRLNHLSVSRGKIKTHSDSLRSNNCKSDWLKSAYIFFQPPQPLCYLRSLWPHNKQPCRHVWPTSLILTPRQ